MDKRVFTLEIGIILPGQPVQSSGLGVAAGHQHTAAATVLLQTENPFCPALCVLEVCGGYPNIQSTPRCVCILRQECP